MFVMGKMFARFIMGSMALLTISTQKQLMCSPQTDSNLTYSHYNIWNSCGMYFISSITKYMSVHPCV